MKATTAVRTRIAPSPTGEDLHIGNAYTAYINYILAKKHNGQFIIRIEDTDRSRFVEGSEQRILSSLHWLGITYDEGPDIGGPYKPYRQSERLSIYKEYAETLIKKNHAYYCFCTPQRLEEMRKKQEAEHQPPMYDGLCKHISQHEASKRVKSGEKHVIRLNVPDDGMTSFHDIIRGDIEFENKLIDDQVLIKSDGFPTYHMGVVIDDHIMNITHVIRGEEWISSTPKHILLYKNFGWQIPQYAHVSVLRNPDRSKLSKRKNPVWTSWYKRQGFLPEAILNYFGTLAWSFPDGREIFTSNEMVSEFTLEKLQTTAPIFSTEKLRWMNGEYLRKKTEPELTDIILQFYGETYSHVDQDIFKKIIPLIRERMKTLQEFSTLAGFFFSKPTEYERPLQKNLIDILQVSLKTSEWNHASIEKSIRDAATNHKLQAKDLFMELRIVITGKTVGPPLLESLEVLGKDETLSRLIA